MQSQDITTAAAGAANVRSEATTRLTRAMLAAGIVAGPLFIVASLVQVLTRQGFDLTRQPISMLSLGDLGWIQIANFEVTGLLVLACAVGMRRARAVLHTVAFNVAFLSLIAACFVFARRFAGIGRRGWAAYCAATGVAPVLLIALSAAQGGSGVPLFVMGVITSAWVAALPARLLATER